MRAQLKNSTVFKVCDRHGRPIGSIKLRAGAGDITRAIERLIVDNTKDAGECGIHGQRRFRDRWVPLSYTVTDNPAGLVFRARIYVTTNIEDDYDTLFIIKPLTT